MFAHIGRSYLLLSRKTENCRSERCRKANNDERFCFHDSVGRKIYCFAPCRQQQADLFPRRAVQAVEPDGWECDQRVIGVKFSPNLITSFSVAGGVPSGKASCGSEISKLNAFAQGVAMTPSQNARIDRLKIVFI